MADVELLPLPSPQVPFIDCDPSMTDIRRLVRWYEQGATEHARANVAHATAARDAEIEALRAEVATWEGLHASEVQARQRWQARAERLAEALEDIRSRSTMNLAMHPDPFELTARLGDIYQIADAALARESRNG